MLRQFIAREGAPKADVLVVAGDYCPNFRAGGETGDARMQVEWLKTDFVPFLKTLPFTHIIIVAGNHDWCHYIGETKLAARLAITGGGLTYLEDEAVTIDGKVFYGSPYQPHFFDWAFNFDRLDPSRGYPQAKAIWSKIPDGSNVVVTHGPPLNVLDLCMDGRRVGCPILRDRIFAVKPALHLFGHIHHSYGAETRRNITFGNVALCNEQYQPVNPIQVFEIK